MKKIFETPEMSISVFENEDIVRASGIEAKDRFSYSENNSTVKSNWESMTEVIKTVL